MIETLKLLNECRRDIDPTFIPGMVDEVCITLNEIIVDEPGDFELILDNSRYKYTGDTSMFYTPMNFQVHESFVEVTSEDGFTASFFGCKSVIVLSNLLVNICDVEDSLIVVNGDTVVNFLGRCVRNHVFVSEKFKDRIILNTFASCETKGSRFYIGNSSSISSVNRTMFT